MEEGTPDPIYPRLPGGRGGIGRARTEQHQRGRLEGAMVEAVWRHGYSETTVAELVGLAGVSKSTFYDHFESKQECFLATFDTIIAQARQMVGTAYREPREPDERLARAMARFADVVADETPAASLVIVASLSLGPAALAHRERAAEAFELMFRQSFASVPGEVEPSDLVVRSIVAGIRRVVYRCLRAGHPEHVRRHCEDLLEWAQCYQLEAASRPGGRVERRGWRGEAEGSTRRELPWEESPSSRVCRARLTQRERIVRAAAQIAAESGYATLTIPAISARAGTSNQTFYEHFESKDEAFIAAFEELSGRARRAIAATSAGQPDWRTTVEAGTTGLLEHLAAEPIFARLAFIELPMVGTTGLDQADAATSRFTAFLQPEALPPDVSPVPPMVIEAIGGGMWGAIQHEIGTGNLAGLPDLAPSISAVALAPLRVADRAG